MILLRILVVIFLASFLTIVHAAEQINGAGATFPYPIYSKWFSEYHKLGDHIQINYQSIGSGGGIRQLLDGTVDFGASDAPMKDQELAKAKSPILHIPTVMGAVVISYNLPEVKESLRLSAEVISEIYLGQIVDWSDPKIKALNPGVSLKKRPILVAYRADGSGTTAVFTDYLAKVSPEFLEKVGEGKAVRWPVGVGAKGNEGVSGVIKQTPGALGYIELAYAETNKLGVAHIKNKAGHFVKPSVHTVSAAAAAEADKMPADYRVSITNADGKDSYPIAAFTYLLVYQDMPGKKGKELVKFLNWAMKDGQKLAEPMLYSPLPDNLRKRVATTISSIKVQ